MYTLVDYIKRQRLQNVSDKEITRTLKIHGLTDAEIERGFASIDSVFPADHIDPAELLPKRKVTRRDLRAVANTTSAPRNTFSIGKVLLFVASLVILIFGGLLFAHLGEYTKVPYMDDVITMLGIGFGGKVDPEMLREHMQTLADASSYHYLIDTKTTIPGDLARSFEGMQALADGNFENLSVGAPTRENTDVTFIADGVYNAGPNPIHAMDARLDIGGWITDLDVTLIDERVYFRVTKLPVKGFLGAEEYLNQWLYLDPDRIQDSALMESVLRIVTSHTNWFDAVTRSLDDETFVATDVYQDTNERIYALNVNEALLKEKLVNDTAIPLLENDITLKNILSTVLIARDTSSVGFSLEGQVGVAGSVLVPVSGLVTVTEINKAETISPPNQGYDVLEIIAAFSGELLFDQVDPEVLDEVITQIDMVPALFAEHQHIGKSFGDVCKSEDIAIIQENIESIYPIGVPECFAEPANAMMILQIGAEEWYCADASKSGTINDIDSAMETLFCGL